jgi:hypothetical protein
VPNITVPNLKMLMRHGAECTKVPNYNMLNWQGIDVIKCRMYQCADNRQIVELLITNPALLGCSF